MPYPNTCQIIQKSEVDVVVTVCTVDSAALQSESR